MFLFVRSIPSLFGVLEKLITFLSYKHLKLTQILNRSINLHNAAIFQQFRFDLTITVCRYLKTVKEELNLSKYLMPKNGGGYALQKGKPPVPQEDDFQITQPLAYMQRGLSAAYQFSDFIYVLDDQAQQLESLDMTSFRTDLQALVLSTYPKNFKAKKSELHKLSAEQLLITAFDINFWNSLNENRVDPYQPSWNLPKQQRLNQVHDAFPEKKKNFYKFNVKILFQVKKVAKDKKHEGQRHRNPLTLQVIHFLQKHGLRGTTLEGESRSFCGTHNAIMAGRFNDGLQKPKDPYTFYLHCLLGYDKPEHVGGSYLIAQKCVFDWFNIHTTSESLPGIMGRNDIKNGSSIFSQHHCQRSHIKLSRIKDDTGLPVTMHRESKAFVSEDFDPLKRRGVTDNINPEEGLFFLAYHKDPAIIERMMISQLGNTGELAFEDGLLNYFEATHGNVFYVPNVFEMTGLSMKRADINPKVASLCEYHQTRWLKDYRQNEEDETNHKATGNQFYLYSRAGFMKKMSYAHEYDEHLDPPSPRVLRLLSKTFSIWQDTWYFNRHQVQFGHLQEFMLNKPEVLKELSLLTGFDFGHYDTYKKLPMVVRNGLAIHYNLAYVVSTKQFGCRGPVGGNPKNRFGAGTFFLDPEDVLVGAGANLTFGQGKYLIEYLTEDEMQSSWLRGRNLSAHSGIGHVLPELQEILTIGLGGMIQEFQKKADQYKGKNEKKYNLFISTVFSLLGMKRYLLNYAQLAQQEIEKLGPKQVATRQNYQNIKELMLHIAQKPPVSPTENRLKALRQGAQILLSTYFCNHLSGEPISIGRADYILRNYAIPVTEDNYKPCEEEQDIFDNFWVKVGYKANFNKSFFEDHQKWGHMAIGGNSGPYPQGGSPNQWGQQIVVGGSTPDDKPFYNSVTIACLIAARRIPVNAPCLNLRLHPDTPKFIMDQAAKTLLSGGAHPVLANDKKIVAGLQRSGDYKISKEHWDKLPIIVDGKPVDVPYQYWDTTVSVEDSYNYSPDGCHEPLMAGKTWFWLGGANTLGPLQLVLNVGKNLLHSGPRFIHGQRLTYRWRELQTYQTYEQLEEEYFAIFQQFQRRATIGMLSNYENNTAVCPATLLNAFTTDMRKRESDFYENGCNYKIFAPQFTGVANLTNALWNIKKLVFEEKVTSLQEVRQVLLVNWGDQLEEPFVSKTLPPIMKQRLKERCDMLRELGWKQDKFGLDQEVTQFGFRLSKRMSLIMRKIFEQPDEGLLRIFKTLTYKYGSKEAPFGFQYGPGGATFSGFADQGIDVGASFDGRKKSQALADDYSPQGLMYDVSLDDQRINWGFSYLEDVLRNYTYEPVTPDNPETNDPQFFTGSILDVNVDEDYDQGTLVYNLEKFAQGQGPNLLTISVGSRKLLIESALNTDRDLLRFRQGGWTEYTVSMFPIILEHHIRRRRYLAKQIEDKQYEEEEAKEEEQVEEEVEEQKAEVSQGKCPINTWAYRQRFLKKKLLH